MCSFSRVRRWTRASFVTGWCRVFTDTQKALVRSQPGPAQESFLPAIHGLPLCRVDAQVSRMLLRRLCRPLPLCSSAWWRGCPLEDLGQNQSACARSGVLGSAAARVCSDAGRRVILNVRVIDLDQPARARPKATRSCRGRDAAVSRLTARGGHHGVSNKGRRQTCPSNVPLWMEVFSCEQGNCPELSIDNGCARLVVLASEVGSRWWTECQSFLGQLAKVKVTHEPRATRASVYHSMLR